MSFTTPDLADHVFEVLADAGYSIPSEDELPVPGTVDEDAFWSFADYRRGGFESSHAAAADALDDYVARTDELRQAAARVIGNWERGDLAGAVNELRVALDASIQVDIDDFIKEHSQ